MTGYQATRTELLDRLRRRPELARLRIDEGEDWIVGLVDAWAALSEVFGFYQERILEEAFLATAQQPSSVELIYHSLGHRFPPNATATTTLAYHLTPKVAGVEAVGRTRSRGGTGTGPEERARQAAGGITGPAGALPMPGPGGSVPAGAGGASGAGPGSAGGYGGPGVAGYGGAPGTGGAGGLGGGTGGLGGGAGGAGEPDGTGGPDGTGEPGGGASPLLGAGVNAPASVEPPPGPPPGIAMPGGALTGPVPGAAGGPAAAGAYGGPLGGSLPGSGGTAIPTGMRPTGGRPFVGTPAGIAIGPAPIPDAAPAIGLGSQIPPAAQVRAIPSASGAAPVFVTLAPLGAFVGASRLGVSTPTTQPPPKLATSTSQLELAGAKTGLAVGQAVLVTATNADGSLAQWVRVLTTVKPDADRGSTRIAWDTPLGAKGEPAPDGTSDPVVYGFSASSSLVGATVSAWSACTLAQQLATATIAGRPLPVRGGLGSSDDDGVTWALDPSLTPVGADLGAVGCYDDVTIVAAGSAWLQRSVGGGPYSAVATGGGARRAVGFLGGSPTRMLAGAASGTVYESIDQGQTWSVVSGGAPALLKGPSDSKTVVTNQLPAATVRCVVDGTNAGVDLLAGTDAGLYGFADGNWLPVLKTGGVSEIAVTPTVALPYAIFALAPITDGYVAATSSGVWESDATSWTQSLTSTGTALTAAATALATAAKSVYAATADGIAVRDIHGDWSGPAGTGLPAGTRVTALLVAGGNLLAATAQGIYSADLDVPTLTFTRCDRAPAFSLPEDVLDPPAVIAPVPDKLYAAFADYGIALSAAARVAPAPVGVTLTDGAHAYALVPTTTTWNVTLLDALPSVNDLALTPDGAVLAASAAAAPVANAWPGFAVAGTAVEFAPPLRSVTAGAPALIEQRTLMPPTSQVLDVTQVDQDAGIRFGRRTTLTRLTFTTPLAAREFLRSAATVWTGATAKPLFVPPATAVAQVAGKSLTLSSQLPAPVAPGRLATVSGAPPGLAVAPLGGTFRIATPTASPAPEGPPQADVNDLAGLPDSTVLAATAEGVFLLADGAPAQLLDQHWPGGASAALAVAGTTALAASAHGVQCYVPATQHAPASWTTALRAREITALATDRTAVAACEAGGAVHLASDAQHWHTISPALAESATALAVSGQRLWAATPQGVFAFDEVRGWQRLGSRAPAGQITCLQLDDAGQLWAGGTAGLQSVDPATGAWALDPDVTGPVPALCLSPTNVLFAYGAGGVLQRQGSTWTPVSAGVGAAVTALAGALDGSLWLGTGATLPLPTLPGAGAQQVSHTPLVPALSIDASDAATLAQGAVPDRLLAAFADAGSPLDPAHAVVTGDGPDCWLIRVAAQLYVVALRRGATSPPKLTLTVHSNQAVLHPTAAPTTANGVQTWPIEVSGTAATLSAPVDRIVSLPADADSPALAESVTLSAPGGEAVTTVGAGTALAFTHPLTHVYDASTVQVDLNVVPAAQGQPVSVPIGSGDPKVANQRFAVPTPIVAIGPTASTPAATTPATSLRVYVDQQPWTEVASLHSSGPGATVYVTQHNADGTATVSFGDGTHGARLPAGHDNVVATYLQGGGAGGEVARGTLIQPLARPQLVKAVQNPLAALVPATPALVQSRMAAVRGLDRAITHADYEDLAAAQAGVATATAELIAATFGRALVISVAGAASAPADLVRRVQEQVGMTAPSGVPVRVVTARLVPVAVALEVVSAIHPHSLEAALRDALGGLTGHRPGGALLASQLLAAATSVPGVTAATITGWARDGRHPSTDTRLSGQRATWLTGDPVGAELLVVDADALAIAVVAPRAVART